MSTSVKRYLVAAAAMAFAAQSTPGYVSISGRVLDLDAQPIAEARVRMVGSGLETRTLADGTFLLTNDPAAGVMTPAASTGRFEPVVRVREGVLLLNLSTERNVRAELFGLDGRLTRRVEDRVLPSGHHHISLHHAGARGTRGVEILRIRIDSESRCWRLVNGRCAAGSKLSAASDASRSPIGMVHATADTSYVDSIVFGGGAWSTNWLWLLADSGSVGTVWLAPTEADSAAMDPAYLGNSGGSDMAITKLRAVHGGAWVDSFEVTIKNLGAQADSVRVVDIGFMPIHPDSFAKIDQNTPYTGENLWDTWYARFCYPGPGELSPYGSTESHASWYHTERNQYPGVLLQPGEQITLGYRFQPKGYLEHKHQNYVVEALVNGTSAGETEWRNNMVHLFVTSGGPPPCGPFSIGDTALLSRVAVGKWGGKTWAGQVNGKYGWWVTSAAFCPAGRYRGQLYFEPNDGSTANEVARYCGTFSCTTGDPVATVTTKWLDGTTESGTLNFHYRYGYLWLGDMSGEPIPYWPLTNELTEDDCVTTDCTAGGTGTITGCSGDYECGRCWYCDNGQCRYGGEGPYGCYRGWEPAW